MTDLDALEAFRRQRGLLSAEDLEAWLAIAGLTAEEWAERVIEGRTEGLPDGVTAGPRRPPPEAPCTLPAGEVAPPQVWMRHPGTCAEAALLTVCAALDLAPPPRPLVRADASLAEIVAAASGLGLRATAVKVSRDRLEELGLPFIAHVDDHHWLVVHRVRPDAIVVSDPARGAGRLDRGAFVARWSGWAAVLEPPVHRD